MIQPVVGADDCRNSCRATEPHCIKLVTVEMVVDAALDLLRLERGAAVKTETSRRSIIQARVLVTDKRIALDAAGTD